LSYVPSMYRAKPKFYPIIKLLQDARRHSRQLSSNTAHDPCEIDALLKNHRRQSLRLRRLVPWEDDHAPH